MRSTALPLLLVALLGSACGGAPPPAENPSSEGAAAPAAVPSPARAAGLVGRWGPTLPPTEAHAVTTARCALADPPDRAAFERLQPTDADRANFQALVKLRTTEPDSPLLANVRRKLADYESMLVEISPTEIGFRTRSSDSRHPYTVVSAREDVVTIDVKDQETLDVRILDENHIEMRGRTRTFFLTREGAEGMSAAALDGRDPPAASNGPRPLPGREGLGDGRPVVVPGPGARPGGGPPDACTAYADCIDQMPRLGGDQAIMNGSSSTIRGWERTPDRLRSCASAHELARSAGLCR